MLNELFESDEAKRVLAEETSKVVAAGAFGLPTMLVSRGSETSQRLFFGSDRVGVVADYLGVPYSPKPTAKL